MLTQGESAMHTICAIYNNHTSAVLFQTHGCEMWTFACMFVVFFYFILSVSFLFLSFCYSFVHGSAAKKQIPTDTPTQTRIYITKGNEIICIIIIALCVFGLVGLFFISCGVFDLLHLLRQEHRSTYTTIPFLMKMISKN